MTLEIFTADCLAPLRHGFFSRRGGASSGIFKGLNCGPGSSDLAEAVAINRARVTTAMGLSAAEGRTNGGDTGALVTLHQVHSAKVVTLESAPLIPPQADGMATATPGLVLGVLTADCQPVLFADHEAGVIGATHAGWRGALDGVLEATLEAMESLGADRANTVAVIGPTISQRAYEVGPEFLETFLADDPGNSRFFAQGNGDRVHFDLPGYGLHRLRNAGVAHAEWTRQCTYFDSDSFYSYRRSVHLKEADYGRLISAIRL